MSCTLHQILVENRMKRHGWAEHVARIFGRKMRTKFQSLIFQQRDHLGDLGVGWMIILTLILKKIVRESVDWIRLAQDRVQGHAVLNTIVLH